MSQSELLEKLTRLEKQLEDKEKYPGISCSNPQEGWFPKYVFCAGIRWFVDREELKKIILLTNAGTFVSVYLHTRIKTLVQQSAEIYYSG